MQDATWHRRDVGWFRYGRHPEGRVGSWKVTRVPEDPPIVIYQTGDGWIVDDEPGEQHTMLHGLTEDEIGRRLRLLWQWGGSTRTPGYRSGLRPRCGRTLQRPDLEPTTSSSRIRSGVSCHLGLGLLRCSRWRSSLVLCGQTARFLEDHLQ